MAPRSGGKFQELGSYTLSITGVETKTSPACALAFASTLCWKPFPSLPPFRPDAAGVAFKSDATGVQFNVILGKMTPVAPRSGEKVLGIRKLY